VHTNREHAFDGLNLDLRQRLERAQTALLTSTATGAANSLSICAKGQERSSRLPTSDAIGPGFEPLALQLLDRRLQAPRADVDTGDATAFPPEALGDRKADPARGAGDDAHAVLKAGIHALALCGGSAKAFAISRS